MAAIEAMAQRARDICRHRRPCHERNAASRSLFPIDELAINGFAAIPARLPLILRRIREAADAVIAARPDVLVIIDSPDFTHRVARRVRAAAPDIPIVDYVSPTVWAWRPGRAAAMRRYVDHVLALLPFEPEAHRRLGGPPCTYVGHPLAEAVATLRPTPRRRRGATPRRRWCWCCPAAAAARSAAIWRPSGRRSASCKSASARSISCCRPSRICSSVCVAIRRRGRCGPRIVVEPAQKWAAFRQARAALAASGTVTLELALAGVPTVVAYKVAIAGGTDRACPRPGAAMIGLANIILGEKVMPELLQRQATARNLAEALVSLIGDTPQRRRQCEAFTRLDAVMEVGGAAPSRRAAAIVVALARRPPQYHPTGRHASDGKLQKESPSAT